MNFDTIPKIGYEVRQSANHPMGKTPTLSKPQTWLGARIISPNRLISTVTRRSPYHSGESPSWIRQSNSNRRSHKGSSRSLSFPSCPGIHHDAEFLELRLVTGVEKGG